VAALAVGEWATAAVVVFFMRLGDYVERFTAERARRAVKDLTALAPQIARLEREGLEVEVPIDQVRVGETVIVRPGEMIPVDGEVIAGQATLDQAVITGESMPVEAGPGSRVFAVTLARLGSLHIRTTQVGVDTTFGRVIKLVEEAEAHRADVQRVADKFSAYYLPVVASIAALTFLLRRDPLATVSVLVVACSCSFALATPIAMLASIGAGAKRGLMIKGGKYLELLDRADVLLIDKTGTLTLGKPEIVDFRLLADEKASSLGDEANIQELKPKVLFFAASAERYSEHPLAEAVRAAARQQGLGLGEPQDFQAVPGLGVRATVDGHRVEVGSLRMFDDFRGQVSDLSNVVEKLESQGKTLLFVAVDGRLMGLLAAADTLRPEVPQAIQQARALGIQEVELLTGDNPRAAAALIASLEEGLGVGVSIRYRASLLPEDKIAAVEAYQAYGRTVVMVGDGVNDAPALAQADVGIALGTGADVALEAADLTLIRDDLALIPRAIQLSRQMMRIIRQNLFWAFCYNVVAIPLAALGLLSPALAALAMAMSSVSVVTNSLRLRKFGK
jgi:Cd2+/Zn2+-exporting ATPase/Cu+-exporting ATPase